MFKRSPGTGKDQYVLVPIDKAANNVGLVCKKMLSGNV